MLQLDSHRRLKYIKEERESYYVFYEEIQKYNETDICIYKYIVSNIDKVQYMTIRELAKAIHISTSTILRFCNKNNFEGYSDFKEALKKEIVLQNTYPPMEELQELSDFLPEQIRVRLKRNCCLQSMLFEMQI